jgi:hypothetical protein
MFSRSIGAAQLNGKPLGGSTRSLPLTLLQRHGIILNVRNAYDVASVSSWWSLIMTIPVNHFDRAKPFYPLIIGYVLQWLGLKELISRAVLGPRAIPQDAVQLGLQPEFLRWLNGPLEMRSEFTGDRIGVDVDDIAREILHEHMYLLPFLLRASGSLLILAHETTKDEPYRDTGPLWEFLRHCRNAAAHRGVFHFVHGEPRRPAVWGHLRIEASLQGLPLFKGEDGHGFLSPGDPVRLLWDVEQAYPSMRV